MRIICDLDNTICETNKYFLYNCKIRFARHDLSYDKDGLIDYHLTDWFVKNNLATEVEAKAMKEEIFNDENYWASIPLFLNAADVLEKINKEHELFLASDAITVYNDVCMTGKKKWLKRFLPFINTAQLIFIKNKSMLVGDYLIEDVVEQVMNFKGTKVLFDYHYNRNYKPDFRVFNWKQIEGIFFNERT
jgi:5'(3')-deoxyribonucleotidase